VSDTAQLAVLVHGVDTEFCVTEGMLGIQPMKDTVTGEDIFQEIKRLIPKYHLSFDKLHDGSTDGAPTNYKTKIRAQFYEF
jgi:hypothetical protein